MSRAQLKFNVTDRNGAVIQSAAVYVYRKGTTTAPYGTMYDAEINGSVLVNPLVSNSQGEIEAWLDTVQLLDLSVTDNADGAFYPSGSGGSLSFTSFTEAVALKAGPSSQMPTDPTTAIGLAIENHTSTYHSFSVFSDNGEGGGLTERFTIENNNPGPVDLDFRNVTINVGNTQTDVSSLVTINHYAEAGASGQHMRVFVPGSTATACMAVGVNGDLVLDIGGLASTAIVVGTAGAANKRWILTEFGGMSWGAGGASALDTTLERSAAATLKLTGKLWVTDELELDGALNHDGTTIGFFGVTPAVRASAYTPTNVSTDRAYDANATTTDELADVLGTLIADLKLYGLLQ